MLYVLICKPAIEKLETKLDLATFSLTAIKLMLPSTFFLILGFFGFLHSWLNCWAEITRFPDRCFYSDWWNSIEFGSYYRKWNIIVHDWLYYFIYVDTCRFSKCGIRNTFMPKLLTFLISAVIHELIITYALGFFYPILFILFTGPGMVFINCRYNIDSEPEEFEGDIGKYGVLAGDVYWWVVVVYLLFGGELCQEEDKRSVYNVGVGKYGLFYSSDYVFGPVDMKVILFFVFFKFVLLFMSFRSGLQMIFG